MGSGFSDILTNKIIKHLTNNGAWTADQSLWVGVSKADPTADGSGMAEPSVGAYARVKVQAANWVAAAAGGSTVNSGAITFPTATSTWLSGSTLKYFAIFDAVTSGSFMAWGPLSVAKPVTAGDTLSFANGELKLHVDYTA